MRYEIATLAAADGDFTGALTALTATVGQGGPRKTNFRRPTPHKCFGRHRAGNSTGRKFPGKFGSLSGAVDKSRPSRPRHKWRSESSAELTHRRRRRPPMPVRPPKRGSDRSRGDARKRERAERYTHCVPPFLGDEGGSSSSDGRFLANFSLKCNELYWLTNQIYRFCCIRSDFRRFSHIRLREVAREPGEKISVADPGKCDLAHTWPVKSRTIFTHVGKGG